MYLYSKSVYFDFVKMCSDVLHSSVDTEYDRDKTEN